MERAAVTNCLTLFMILHCMRFSNKIFKSVKTRFTQNYIFGLQPCSLTQIQPTETNDAPDDASQRSVRSRLVVVIRLVDNSTHCLPLYCYTNQNCDVIQQTWQILTEQSHSSSQVTMINIIQFFLGEKYS